MHNTDQIFVLNFLLFVIPRLWNREGDIEMALSVRPSFRPSVRHLRFLSN